MFDLIFKAMKFAEKAHRGTNRKYNSDEPYILHPMRVAYLVQNYSPWIKVNDENIICAALLHDTAEDCGVSFGTLTQEFNSNISHLVFELTQPDKLYADVKAKSRAERHACLLEKLKSVSTDAKRIKYWDRYDNLKSVDLTNNECYGFLKRRYLQESWDIHQTLNQWIVDDPLRNIIQVLASRCKVDLTNFD